MKNSRAKSFLNDCRLELLKIRGLINSYGSMHTITGFLTQYALIKVSGTFEICYKTIIADYYDSFSPKLQRFVSKQVREASLNATYENITKVLKMFDEVKCARFKSNVTALDKEKKSTNSLSDINKARNNVAHGSMSTMSFNDIQSKFYKSILIFQELDKVMI